MQDAARRRHDPLVQELLALLYQRSAREYQIKRSQGPLVHCQAPACTNIVPQLAAGRWRRYCSHPCRQAAYRERKRLQREKLRASQEAGQAA